MKYLKRIICVLVSVGIIVTVIKVAETKCFYVGALEENTVRSFYNEKSNSLDYIVIGSSGAQCDIFPAVIWEKSNLTGNVLAIDGCDSRIYLSMLKEIQNKHQDYVLLVDIDGFASDGGEPGSSRWWAARRWIDLMKHNNNWLETIERCDSENRLEHYFPIMGYHKYLLDMYFQRHTASEELLESGTTVMKGANSLGDMQRLSQEEMAILTPFVIEKEEQVELISENQGYLIAFLDYCKDNNISDVVFINFPKAVSDAKKFELVNADVQRSRCCERIVKEYGYDVIDFNAENNMESILAQDYVDSYHLKQSGAIKVSEYLADYLSSHYQFREKDAATFDEWEQSTKQAYEQFNLR